MHCAQWKRPMAGVCRVPLWHSPESQCHSLYAAAATGRRELPRNTSEWPCGHLAPEGADGPCLAASGGRAVACSVHGGGTSARLGGCGACPLAQDEPMLLASDGGMASPGLDDRRTLSRGDCRPERERLGGSFGAGRRAWLSHSTVSDWLYVSGDLPRGAREPRAARDGRLSSCASSPWQQSPAWRPPSSSTTSHPANHGSGFGSAGSLLVRRSR
mmetsp:Transcript_30207/g.85185  ORF Transcript_30207/g.85185 Transcript_30207/m.85185 type:complete len:215 (+) Transcript_30207:1073-1717(+)